ncbi:transcriptional regulator FtrA [Azospirillum agricola]|uniref:transcriptional regulator FtrA n=1 Tax=Azospirillum agricola TaxID=1720247 RepID=UPI000A0F2546|nr:transcriptional regulator FtrA [Azospirillum agricola]SMH60175.1 transcriptional regulator, AraC family with amidase-like domain [Azospirillum lipoferum]
MPVTVRIMPNTPHLVVALAYDGLCTFEFGVAVEVFGLPRPELGPDWYRFAVAALDPGPLRAMGGVRLLADGGLELLEAAGTIVIPGWRGAREPVPAILTEALRRAHARGARILSICSGAFVLAAAGLLNGRRATTHWRYAETLGDLYPAIRVAPDVLYVDEGNILTSAGSAAGIDLCLHLVRRDFGPEAANSVARRLVVQPHREGGQAQFIETPVPTAREGARLGPLLDHLRERLEEEHTLASMAERAGMSLRTFLRRFNALTGRTPGEWLLAERLARARALLESGETAVEEVATRAGFGSAATLRHHFRQRLGISPATYRARFRRSV